MALRCGLGSHLSMPALSSCDYAIVDCETTGLFPGAHHRIIEVAVIHKTGLAGETREWSSLINPERDLGDAGIHGIRGRDVRDAPTLHDLAGTLLDLLAGRVLIAHNARFDSAFLEAELLRVGYDVSPLSTLCTIQMASTLGVRRARLDDYCPKAGASPLDRHQALADARLCACLFAELGDRALRSGLDSTASFGCSEPRDKATWPRTEARAAPVSRGHSSTRPETSYLSRLVAARGGLEDEGSAEATAYAELLDRALEDRRLSEEERRDLHAAAELYGLSGPELNRVHGGYLDALCDAAIADDVLTDRERYDLGLVAELLGQTNLEARLRAAEVRRLATSAESAPTSELDRGPGIQTTPAGPTHSLTGKSVCFTGKLLCTLNGELITRERAQQLARDAGMRVQKGVTQDLDILVVADPETASGKARKARRYGTRVISEAVFWPLIGVSVN